MDRVKDKVAIVTGAALGLGRGEAILLGKEGAKVAVVDINDEAGRETVEIIRNAGGEAEYWHLNVANESECKTVIDAVVEKWGKLDILVNNAGIVGEDVPTDKTTEENWDKVFAVNVKSTFFMTKHSIPHMRKNGKGAIVNTSSICGLVGDGELSSYHATKGAILQMTKQDAVQYAPEHIRVNCVCPGSIMTPLMHDRLKVDPQYFEKDLQRYPLGYFGEPEDVAYGVLFLASDEGRFVTGAALPIDGGYTAQ